MVKTIYIWSLAILLTLIGLFGIGLSATSNESIYKICGQLMSGFIIIPSLRFWKESIKRLLD